MLMKDIAVGGAKAIAEAITRAFEVAIAELESAKAWLEEKKAEVRALQVPWVD